MWILLFFLTALTFSHGKPYDKDVFRNELNELVMHWESPLGEFFSLKQHQKKIFKLTDNKFEPIQITELIGNVSVAAAIDYPTNMIGDSVGKIYVLDCNGQVSKLTPHQENYVREVVDLQDELLLQFDSSDTSLCLRSFKSSMRRNSVSVSSIVATQGIDFTGAVFARAGESVSISGDVNGDGKADMLIGAPYCDNQIGRVYLIYGSSSLTSISLGSVSAPLGIVITGEPIHSYTGNSVSIGGDVNGDGKADILIGASSYSSDTGRVYLIYGSSSLTDIALGSLTATQGIVVTGVLQASSNTGISVSIGGDVNGDGKADMLIGASSFSSFSGRVYLIYGSSSLTNIALGSLTATQGITISGESGQAGRSVSIGGDVNGDGKADMLISAFTYSSLMGRVYLIYGSANLTNIALGSLTTTQGIVVTGESSSKTGSSVSIGGDVNGDGKADILIGASSYSSDAGRVYLIYGSSSLANIALGSLTATQGIVMTGKSINSYTGVSVSIGGDVNGDGKADMLIGANGFSSFTGRAYLIYGVSLGNIQLRNPVCSQLRNPATQAVNQVASRLTLRTNRLHNRRTNLLWCRLCNLQVGPAVNRVVDPQTSRVIIRRGNPLRNRLLSPVTNLYRSPLLNLQGFPQISQRGDRRFNQLCNLPHSQRVFLLHNQVLILLPNRPRFPQDNHRINLPLNQYPDQQVNHHLNPHHILPRNHLHNRVANHLVDPRHNQQFIRVTNLLENLQGNLPVNQLVSRARNHQDNPQDSLVVLLRHNQVTDLQVNQVSFLPYDHLVNHRRSHQRSLPYNLPLNRLVNPHLNQLEFPRFNHLENHLHYRRHNHRHSQLCNLLASQRINPPDSQPVIQQCNHLDNRHTDRHLNQLDFLQISRLHNLQLNQLLNQVFNQPFNRPKFLQTNLLVFQLYNHPLSRQLIPFRGLRDSQPDNLPLNHLRNRLPNQPVFQQVNHLDSLRHNQLHNLQLNHLRNRLSNQQYSHPLNHPVNPHLNQLDFPRFNRLQDHLDNRRISQPVSLQLNQYQVQLFSHLSSHRHIPLCNLFACQRTNQLYNHPLSRPTNLHFNRHQSPLFSHPLSRQDNQQLNPVTSQRRCLLLFPQFNHPHNQPRNQLSYHLLNHRINRPPHLLPSQLVNPPLNPRICLQLNHLADQQHNQLLRPAVIQVISLRHNLLASHPVFLPFSLLQYHLSNQLVSLSPFRRVHQQVHPQVSRYFCQQKTRQVYQVLSLPLNRLLFLRVNPLVVRLVNPQ
jgi:hypothetical protein